jgi:SAM-dependent methyltransferase
MPMPTENTREKILLSHLKALYRQQVAKGTIDYLKDHSNNEVIIRGHVRTFLRYADFIRKGAILDWGCLHAPDSCLLRHEFGKEVTLYGSDIYNVPGFEVFHRYAQLDFKPLEHSYNLPYQDAFFDSVIGSGVIEHVAMPAESLRELHRILKSDGTLVLTYMPSSYSFTEFVLRLLKMPHHRRRFTVADVKRRLIDSGFIPEHIWFHEVTPTLSSTGLAFLRNSFFQAFIRFLYSLNPFFERLYPFNRLGQNIMVIARRADSV